MSSTHASPEADSRSENYLAAFSHRESDIIRSVVASVLAGEVPRDAIAEAVQQASDTRQARSSQCYGAVSSLATECLVGRSSQECAHAYDDLTNDNRCDLPQTFDIDVDGHDREMQRLLANEKMLQDDLRNMGLIFEDLPTVDQTLDQTNQLPDSAAVQDGAWVRPIEEAFQGDLPQADVLDHTRHLHPDNFRPHKHGSQCPGDMLLTSRAKGSGKDGSGLKGTRSPASNSHRSGQIRQHIRPQSAGPSQSLSQRSRRTGSSRSPLPRVAFLGTAKCHKGGQQQRQSFPLVGGLQSELDNNEAYSILGDTLKRTGRIDAGHEQDVYARQVAWMARVHAKADTMRRELVTDEIGKCTFCPNSPTQSNSPKVSQTAVTQLQRNCASHPLWDVRMQQHGSIESMHAMLPTQVSGAITPCLDDDGTPQSSSQLQSVAPGQTLYERGRRQAQKLEDKRRAVHLEEEKEWRQRPARKLSPRIYPQGCLLGTVGTPMARENLRAWEHMWDPGVNPTFRPTTNFGTRMRDTRRRAKSMGATPERATTAPRHLGHTRSHVPCSDELDFREFLERQRLHGARRAARVEQIQRDLHQSCVRTVPMAPGTRRLLSKGMSATSNCMHSLSLEGMVEPYEDGSPDACTATSRPGQGALQRLEYAKDSEVENCTFRPCIRPSSHFRTGRTVEELSMGDSASRAAKIQERTRQKEQMIKQGTPFKPRLYIPPKSIAGVRGKVARDADYLQRCRDNEVQREQKRQSHQARKQAEEMKECTFRPKTGRMPKLIRDMISAAQSSIA